MQRYTAEQKEEALISVGKIGVSKTHKETGISIQTLYKWRNEAKNPVYKVGGKMKCTRC